jgi:hypothetical protein
VIQSLNRVIQAIETGLGFFFHMALTLIFGMLIGLMLFDLPRLSPRDGNATLWIFLPMAALWLAVDAPSLWHNWRAAFSPDRPVLVAAAMRQFTAPLLLRPIVALWWLLHFAFGVYFILLSGHLGADARDRNPEIALTFFLAFAYGLATNGFLIYAIASLVHSRRILERVWSFRILIDLALAALGAAVAQWHIKIG